MTYMELNLLSTEKLIIIREEEIKRIETNEEARQLLIKEIMTLQTIKE